LGLLWPAVRFFRRAEPWLVYGSRTAVVDRPAFW
jgi:hypothetical protein